MGAVNGWILSELSVQDWAKTIPLEVVGPWSYIGGGGGWKEEHLPLESWQRVELEVRANGFV